MPADPAAPPPPGGPPCKVRFRFAKAGPLRWLSHHDLLRTFERALRRAELPVRQTQGFHPKPRLVFALSLPLGVVGRAEVAELELDEALPADEVLTRLRRHCPPGLDILEVSLIPPRQTAHVRGLCYAVDVPPDRAAATAARLAEVLAAPECVVERTRPPRRMLDVRPFVRDLRLDPHTGRLEIDLWLLPSGTARPDEALALLGLGDLLEGGAVLERAGLDLADDHPTPREAPEGPHHHL